MSGAAGLSLTALYTAGTWAWAGLPGAELLDHAEARRVFGAVNAALALARPLMRRPPSLRCSLVQRHLMIDRLLADSGAVHVLELAAGLAGRGARVSTDRRIVYTEIDLPPVMARKRALLERSETGRAVLRRPNLRLLAADLARAPLAPLVTAPKDALLFVIAEGIFMYLDQSAQRELWVRIHALAVQRPLMLVFDLVPAVEQPAPGPAGRALERLMKRFTEGQSFARDRRTRDDLRSALSGIGFRVQLVEPRDVAAAWGLPYAGRRTQQLLFVCCAGAAAP